MNGGKPRTVRRQRRRAAREAGPARHPLNLLQILSVAVRDPDLAAAGKDEPVTGQCKSGLLSGFDDPPRLRRLEWTHAVNRAAGGTAPSEQDLVVAGDQVGELAANSSCVSCIGSPDWRLRTQICGIPEASPTQAIIDPSGDSTGSVCAPG